MIKFFFTLSFLFTFLIFSSANAEVSSDGLTFHYNDYAPSIFSNKISVVNWDSEEGILRLERSKYKGDFFRLAHHVRVQEEPSTCGIASAVTVLGAIYQQKGKKMPLITAWPIPLPTGTVALEYRLWNETNFFNEKTDEILNRKAIIMRYPHDKSGKFMGGIDIEEVAKMLEVHGVKVSLTKVDDASESKINEFRGEVKKVVMDKKTFMIANFGRSYQGIKMGGHYSPIAAYDEESDSVLILDVASHRNPWIWISLEDFYKSMNTKNYADNSYRGFMIIK